MRLTDTHCHLNFPVFDHLYDIIIKSCLRKNIGKIIVPAIKAVGWDQLIIFCQLYPEILYPALGLHPLFINEHNQNDLVLLEELIKKNKPIAIGEIGLDYFDKTLDKALQQYFFEAQVKLAQKYKLPIIVHARKSHHDILMILKKIKFDQYGTIHAFNGSLEQAQEYIKLGFKLGFGGMVTHPKARHITNLATNLPLSSIVLETDAPDMPLFEQAKSYNSPENILLIAQKMATMRNISLEEIANNTTENANRIFKL